MPIYTDYFNDLLVVYGRHVDDVIASPGHGFGVWNCLQIQAKASMNSLI